VRGSGAVRVESHKDDIREGFQWQNVATFADRLMEELESHHDDIREELQEIPTHIVDGIAPELKDILQELQSKE
jgi:hypothetical protein